MKKLLTIAACICALSAFNAYAQGTFNFGNRVAGVVDAPVFDVGGARLAGPDAFAQLWAGPSADALAAVGSPVAFRSGTGAGYWPSTAVTVPSVLAGANAIVQVRAWKGAAGSTYDSAKAAGQAYGESASFSAKAGGDGSPPAVPGNLAQLTSFTLVPEPSVMALGVLGAAALFLRRRK